MQKQSRKKSTGVCHCSSVLISLSYLADSDQSLTLRNAANIRQHIQNLKVIDNQKKLTQLSRAIERWDAARLPFFSPSCSILENKSDWWNPWSPYVWLSGVNSHKRRQCCVDCAKHWQVISFWCLISSVLTAVTNMCHIWHTTPWAKNFTLVLLVLTVIYKKTLHHGNVDSDYSSVSLHHVVSELATLDWAAFRSMMLSIERRFRQPEQCLYTLTFI